MVNSLEIDREPEKLSEHRPALITVEKSNITHAPLAIFKSRIVWQHEKLRTCVVTVEDLQITLTRQRVFIYYCSHARLVWVSPMKSVLLPRLNPMNAANSPV